MKQDLTKEKLVDFLKGFLRDFVECQDDNFEDQFWGTKRDAAEDVLTRLCAFMELPPLMDPSTLGIDKEKLSEAHALWREAVEELTALKEKEDADQ